jgi:hypothetical protein
MQLTASSDAIHMIASAAPDNSRTVILLSNPQHFQDVEYTLNISAIYSAGLFEATLQILNDTYWENTSSNPLPNTSPIFSFSLPSENVHLIIITATSSTASSTDATAATDTTDTLEESTTESESDSEVSAASQLAAITTALLFLPHLM